MPYHTFPVSFSTRGISLCIRVASTFCRTAVSISLKFFLPSFNKLTIRATFGSDDQAMLAFDLDCPLPIGIVRTAALITFKDGLIVQIEAFFDPRSIVRG